VPALCRRNGHASARSWLGLRLSTSCGRLSGERGSLMWVMCSSRYGCARCPPRAKREPPWRDRTTPVGRPDPPEANAISSWPAPSGRGAEPIVASHSGVALGDGIGRRAWVPGSSDRLERQRGCQSIWRSSRRGSDPDARQEMVRGGDTSQLRSFAFCASNSAGLRTPASRSCASFASSSATDVGATVDLARLRVFAPKSPCARNHASTFSAVP
jgi:hypothetical protein